MTTTFDDERVTRIFLTHAASDDAFARVTQGALEDLATELRVWRASEDLRSGQWAEQIRDQIERSDCALFLITPNFLTRPWLLLEWGAFWALRRDPHMLLVDVDPNSLPKPLQSFEMVDVHDLDSVASKILGPLASPGVSTRRAAAGSMVNALVTKAFRDVAGRISNAARDASTTWTSSRVTLLVNAIDSGAPATDRDLLRFGIDVAPDVVRTTVLDGYPHPSLVATLIAAFIDADRFDDAMALLDRVDEPARVTAVARLLARQRTAVEVEQIVAAVERISDGAVRRSGAEVLLDAGHTEAAIGVASGIDQNYQRRRFCLPLIASGSWDQVRDVAETMTVNKEIRIVAEHLVASGDADAAALAITLGRSMTQNAEKRNLCRHCLSRGRVDLVMQIASSITVGVELQRVCLDLVEAGHDEAAVDLAAEIGTDKDRRPVLMKLLASHDPVDLANRLSRSASRLAFALDVADIDLRKATAVATTLLAAEQRKFWCALLGRGLLEPGMLPPGLHDELLRDLRPPDGESEAAEDR